MGGFVYVLGPCGPLQWTLLWGWAFLPPCNPYRFYDQRFWDFIFPCWNTGLCGLSCSSVILPGYLHTKVGPLGLPPPPCCQSSLSWLRSPHLLPVWMNVSSLNLWLSYFHTVWFSGSSGDFLFLNLLSFFACVRRQSVSPMPASWLEVNSFMSNEFVLWGGILMSACLLMGLQLAMGKPRGVYWPWLGFLKH